MAENFYTILTSIGQAKIANSQVTGQKVNLAEIAAGDGNGSYYNPDQSQTALRKEVWRGNISAVQIDEENSNWIVIEGVIPSSAGGFFVREVGVFDEEGDLIAIGKYPETYKPVAAEGSAKDLYIRMIIEVTNASAVQLKIDPSVIIASREYVDKNLEQKANQVKQEAKNYTDQQMAVAEANAKNYTDQKIAQLPDLTWDNLQDKPSAFPPSSHTHNISEVTGLQAALQDIENKIGDLSNLSTDQKANLVAAVNELKTRLDNMGDTTGQSLTQLMNALNELIDEVAAHLADYTSFKSDVGNKNNLLTSDKTSLVAAINEVFTTGNNVKSDTVGALLSVDDSLPITSESTWQDIINAIGQISTGKKWASGVVPLNEVKGTDLLIISGIDFEPSIVLAFSGVKYSNVWLPVLTCYVKRGYPNTSYNTMGVGGNYNGQYNNNSRYLSMDKSFYLYGSTLGITETDVTWFAYE